jgi:hypothetical protein
METTMNRRLRPLVGLVLAGLLVWPMPAQSASDNASTTPPIDPAAMTMDLVLARPGGLVATVAGAAIFVVSLPFSALGGNVDEAFASLVATPATYTFRRPLGDFEAAPPAASDAQ